VLVGDGFGMEMFQLLAFAHEARAVKITRASRRRAACGDNRADDASRRCGPANEMKQTPNAKFWLMTVRVLRESFTRNGKREDHCSSAQSSRYGWRLRCPPRHRDTDVAGASAGASFTPSPMTATL